ncbi:hypothetical protein HJC23_005941 [Cyclotella cryptica]|uniref:Orc1-like AAA ATPase domain-containing protein n=1 Tax=Cyclotella cryptica TaxID=29204 RepID=A0ABD3QZK3_9STRA|eukprot:CCRYP_000513-RB/>CCRYP_000513-RB protein AED:0.02 eAED:0.02 QI:225/1/1/1/1/1/4/190/1327
MSYLCWIPLNAWIALAAHHEKLLINEIIEGRHADVTLPPGADFPSKRNVKLARIKQCVEVCLLLLKRLTRGDDWEEDVDAGLEPSSFVGNSLKVEDISSQNIAVEILCTVNVGQELTGISLSEDGCTINGVQIEANQLRAIIYSTSNVEFVGSIKEMPLLRQHFSKSRHQFLRQLGLLFFQFFCQGESFRNPNTTRDRNSFANGNGNREISRSIEQDDINYVSKLVRMTTLDFFKKELINADVPESICRVVIDLIHSGENDEETSFLSLKDVINELQDIILDRPCVFFYTLDTSNVVNNTEEKIDFGNVVYGREVETNRVLELAAMQSELFRNRLILVGGNGGEGKSFMIEGVKNHLVNTSGWVHVEVKFDRLMHNSPLSAIASAFETFFVSLFSRDDQDQYLTSISVSLQLFLSPSMTVMLCNLIPSLQRLFPTIMQRVISDDDLTALNKESDSTERNQFDEILSDPESSRNRLHYSVRRLVHAISSLGRPLLLVFDDLQWAGRASLDLLTSLMAELDPIQFEENVPISRVLFVGLYRSDEVDHDHILSKMYFPAFHAMATLEVHIIQLHAMTKTACNSMISYALRLPHRLTRSLADIVHAKTLGNVFYIKVFVESLVINKTLSYSMSERRWVWHLDTVKATPITENVAQLMIRNLQILPETTIWALKLLSCFGSKADESILMLLEDHINMIDELRVAIDRNIVEKQGPVYRFSHDILEHGAYDMMSRLEQSDNHLLIGLELIRNTNDSRRSHFRPVSFIAIDQINRAKMLGNSQLSFSVQYANLNLKAAESSMSVSDFASALSYAEHGISFLEGHLWGSNYRLTLRLYDMASKACFTSYQSEKMRRFLDEIFKHTQCLQDKLSSHLLLIETLVLMGKDGHAIDSAFTLLEELDETPPQNVPPAVLHNEVIATKNSLRSYTHDNMKNAPRVSDWNISARMRVLGSMLPALFTSQPQYHPYVACRVINLSIQHGFCSDSPFGLVAYANSLLTTDIDEAYRWGKLSLSLHETFESKDKHPRLQCTVYSFLSFFCEPLQAVVDLLRSNYRDALLVGDAYYACVSINFYVRFCLMCGYNLSDLEKECNTFASQMTKLTKPSACLAHLGIYEAIIELSASPTVPFSLMPGLNISTEEDYLHRLESEGMSCALQAGYFNCLFVDFWYTKYEEAAIWAEKYKCRNQNRFLDVYHAFYEALSAFQLARTSSEKSKLIEVGHHAISLFTRWANHSTWNFENKLLLLQAELLFFTGDNEGAIEKYQASIVSAQSSHFVQEEGLAFELLGSLYLHCGDPDHAMLQMTSAYKCYKKWGAFGIIELRTTAKSASLEEQT